MPRIHQKADEYAINDFKAEISAQRARYGYNSQKALGSALGVAQSTVGGYLRNPENIQLGTLRKMVKLLRLDPMVVLLVLGYSRKEIKQCIAVSANAEPT